MYLKHVQNFEGFCVS